MMIEIVRECQEGSLWIRELSIVHAAICRNHVGYLDDIAQKIVLIDVLLKFLIIHVFAELLLVLQQLDM